MLTRPLPDGKITQRFGENPEYYATYGLAGHEGVDFGAPVGTPVYAAHDGVASLIRDHPVYGNYILLDSDTVQTLYAHLSAALRTGAVRAGDKIALSGNTGTSTGPHLHLGVRPKPIAYGNGYRGYVKPELYLRGEVMDEEIRAARWHVEEAVREIERFVAILPIELLISARKRLVDEVLPRLYALEGRGQ